MASFTEENYLKAIYHLSDSKAGKRVTTNELAESMQTKAASVTDMLRRLADKQLIDYQRYQGVLLTDAGKRIALHIIRKHRLWEVFLVNKLGFAWDEIHELAEQLEHIQSVELTERLANFLNHPSFDPHGDPIPNALGEMPLLNTLPLTQMETGSRVKLVGVAEDSAPFLQYIDELTLELGYELLLKGVNTFDQSITVQVMDTNQIVFLSKEVANNLLVTPVVDKNQ